MYGIYWDPNHTDKTKKNMYMVTGRKNGGICRFSCLFVDFVEGSFYQRKKQLKSSLLW